jgi:hypothetical protein
MENPIQVIKDEISYPIEKYAELKTPFKFVAEDFVLSVGSEDTPVYFIRKRMRMVGGKCVDSYIHRYCIGIISKEGTQFTHWIKPTGIYDCINTEQVKIKE